MALIIQKYGGTSVGNLDRIEGVADKVLAAREAGFDVVVVLSAMAGETDRLLGFARAISTHGRPNPRELDALLATGEQVTTALLCMALEKRGITARSFTGFQAGIRTDDAHNKARILDIDARILREQIDKGRVPVVAGFQGMDTNGNITTLGRGGSDTTAVALAAALKADECQIFTDVDGVYTTDPRLVADARRIDRISCAEMLEMSAQGSKVLQVRSVEFARSRGVALRVLSTFEAGPGTLVADEEPSAGITGIAFSHDEAWIRIQGLRLQDEATNLLLALLTNSRIDVDLVASNPLSGNPPAIAFTVPRQEYEQARELIHSQLRDDGLLIEGNPRAAKVALVGGALGTHPDFSLQVTAALAAAGVTVLHSASAKLLISVVVDEIEMEKAVRALHHEFRLNEVKLGVKAG